MTILVLIEHYQGGVADGSLELLTLARTLGGPVTALVLAGSMADVVTLAAGLDADTVLAVAAPAVASYASSVYLRSLNEAIAAYDPELVLLSYSTAGIDLAAGASVATGREMIAYVASLTRHGAGFAAGSQVYGGKLLANSTLPAQGIAVVMPGAVKASARSTGAATVQTLPVDLGLDSRIRHLETLVPESGGIDLTKAARIVCVGRALGNTDKLPMAEALANLLGAEIAGSRPVIDAGWLPKPRQIGKSGTKVKPKLYLMAGVSGAPEHLEGMGESELIIALNSDPRAPIFGKAHYGAVCDMFEVMPTLIQKLS